MIEGFQPHWPQHFRNEIRRLREELASDRLATEALNQAAEKVWDALSASRSAGTAVFCAAGSNPAVSFMSETPYPNRWPRRLRPKFSKTPAPAESKRNRVREVVRPAVSELASQEREQSLAEIRGRWHEGYALATGAQEVLEALIEAQVATLVIGPDPGTVAYRCGGCQSVFVVPHSLCPDCNAAIERVNLCQQILLKARRRNVPVIEVESRAQLPDSTEVVALLTREEAPWAPAAQANAQSQDRARL